MLEQIAPPQLAEEWDNVGLLVEPAQPRKISAVLLTVDLTEEVLVEALTRKVQAVVAYHPPIFRGLKRVTSRDKEGRLVLAALKHNLAVYSPHTALDAAPGGVNDWLGEAFGKVQGQSLSPTGQGRLFVLARPLSLKTAVTRVKSHLGLGAVRLSTSARHQSKPSIEIIAVCAGAGGSVLSGVKADLYLTGEMRHHDVLAARNNGVSVILTDHTNTERGYLAVLRERMLAAFPSVRVEVSRVDRDPLVIC